MRLKSDEQSVLAGMAAGNVEQCDISTDRISSIRRKFSALGWIDSAGDLTTRGYHVLKRAIRSVINQSAVKSANESESNDGRETKDIRGQGGPTVERGTGRSSARGSKGKASGRPDEPGKGSAGKTEK